MSSRLYSLLFILPIIVPESNSALTWRSTDGALFQDADQAWNDPEVSFIQPASPSYDTVSLSDPFTLDDDLTGFSADAPHLFDQAKSSEGPGLFSTDPSESLLEDPGSSIPMLGEDDESTLISLPEDKILEDSSEVADCATSEKLSDFGKSRVRRLDDGNFCPNPSNPLTESPTNVKKPPPSDSGRVGQARRKYNSILQSPELAAFAESVTSDDNKLCYVLSRGLLPFGFCPSTDVRGLSPSTFIDVPPLGLFFAWVLRAPKRGTLIPKICVDLDLGWC